MDQRTHEIDHGAGYIGYQDALDLICSNMPLLGGEEIALDASLRRTAAEAAAAVVDCPLADISLKDGFAVISANVAMASSNNPAALEVIGSAYAGTDFPGRLKSGQAVRVCSGASIPPGADAVIPSEFCEAISGRELRIYADADAGRNILPSGEEVKKGADVIQKGDLLSSGLMGLGAAGGISRIRVYRRPRVAIVAIGDEIVAPGAELAPGQVYASNLVTLKAWLQSFGIDCMTSLVRDNADAIRTELAKRRPAADVILTSGGAWGSERDLIVGILAELGWNKVFHHVRMGPGKGISFGLWENLPVFCLPGGPASNEMAFLQLALPGILRMEGIERHPLPSVPAILLEDISGRNIHWTEFKGAILSKHPDEGYVVSAFKGRSRLQSIAGTNALLCIPEGRDSLRCGERVSIQILTPLP
jgi:molybdopterin molybdotransferase